MFPIYYKINIHNWNKIKNHEEVEFRYIKKEDYFIITWTVEFIPVGLRFGKASPKDIDSRMFFEKVNRSTMATACESDDNLNRLLDAIKKDMLSNINHYWIELESQKAKEDDEDFNETKIYQNWKIRDLEEYLETNLD